jgi:hypothetical protein
VALDLREVEAVSVLRAEEADPVHHQVAVVVAVPDPVAVAVAAAVPDLVAEGADKINIE